MLSHLQISNPAIVIIIIVTAYVYSIIHTASKHTKGTLTECFCARV